MMEVVWFYTKERPQIGEKIRPNGMTFDSQWEYVAHWKQPPEREEVTVQEIAQNCPNRVIDSPGQTAFQVAIFSMN